MPRGKVSLMIVEDDANVRFLLETAALRTDLFDPIASANDGQEALDKLRTSQTPELPGLIVSDLSMPRMTGLDLVRAVKADERMRAISVAIITSSDAPNDRAMALEAGVCSFVHKPYGLDALAQALTAIRDSCETAATTSPRDAGILS